MIIDDFAKFGLLASVKEAITGFDSCSLGPFFIGDTALREEFHIFFILEYVPILDTSGGCVVRGCIGSHAMYFGGAETKTGVFDGQRDLSADIGGEWRETIELLEGVHYFVIKLFAECLSDRRMNSADFIAEATEATTHGEEFDSNLWIL